MRTSPPRKSLSEAGAIPAANSEPETTFIPEPASWSDLCPFASEANSSPTGTGPCAQAGTQNKSAAQAATPAAFLMTLAWEIRPALLLADKIVFIDGDGHTLLVHGFIHPQHPSGATHANGIRQSDLRRQGHYKLDGRAGPDLGIQVHEYAARTDVARVPSQLSPAVVQKFY